MPPNDAPGSLGRSERQSRRSVEGSQRRMEHTRKYTRETVTVRTTSPVKVAPSSQAAQHRDHVEQPSEPLAAAASKTPQPARGEIILWMRVRRSSLLTMCSLDSSSFINHAFFRTISIEGLSSPSCVTCASECATPTPS